MAFRASLMSERLGVASYDQWNCIDYLLGPRAGFSLCKNPPSNRGRYGLEQSSTRWTSAMRYAPSSQTTSIAPSLSSLLNFVSTASRYHAQVLHSLPKSCVVIQLVAEQSFVHQIRCLVVQYFLTAAFVFLVELGSLKVRKMSVQLYIVTLTDCYCLCYVEWPSLAWMYFDC